MGLEQGLSWRRTIGGVDPMYADSETGPHVSCLLFLFLLCCITRVGSNWVVMYTMLNVASFSVWKVFGDAARVSINMVLNIGWPIA